MNDVWLSQGSEIIVWVSNFSSFCILKQGSAIITLRVFFFFQSNHNIDGWALD